MISMRTEHLGDENADPGLQNSGPEIAQTRTTGPERRSAPTGPERADPGPTATGGQAAGRIRAQWPPRRMPCPNSDTTPGSTPISDIGRLETPSATAVAPVATPRLTCRFEHPLASSGRDTGRDGPPGEAAWTGRKDVLFSQLCELAAHPDVQFPDLTSEPAGSGRPPGKGESGCGNAHGVARRGAGLPCPRARRAQLALSTRPDRRRSRTSPDTIVRRATIRRRRYERATHPGHMGRIMHNNQSRLTGNRTGNPVASPTHRPARRGHAGERSRERIRVVSRARPSASVPAPARTVCG